MRRWMTTVLATFAVAAPTAVRTAPLQTEPDGPQLTTPPALEPFAGATTAAVMAAGRGSARQPNASAQPMPPRRFDIDAGQVGAVLAEFERVTGLTVTVEDAALATLPSPGVSGVRTPEDALTSLLANTGLAFRFTGSSTAIVHVRSVRESVDVQASPAPTLSSPKLSGPFRDIPQTVSVIGQQVIREQAATTLRDVLRNVPGITMQAGEGGGGLPGDNLTMRGFSASNDIFVDGVRDVGPYTRDTFNLEQVEVVKGPAGSLAGRGATGGAINLVTKSPQLAPSYDMQIGAGNASYRRTTADVNQPLTALGSGVALRVNAMWQDSGIAGRDVVENGSWAVAPTLAVGLGTSTRAIVSYQHLQQDNVPDYGLPWAAFETTPRADQTSFYGLRDYDFEDIDSDIGTVRLERDVRSGFTLRNVTRLGDTVRDSAITAPRPPNRQLQRRWMANNTFGNLSTINAATRLGGLTHDLAGGVELIRERTENRNSAQTTNQPQTTLIGPNPADRPFGPMPEITGNPSEAVTTTAGAYLFDTVTLASQWQVNGGLRLDRSSVDYSQTTPATGAVLDLSRSDTILTGRAGVVYKPRQNGSIYAAYGTSANPAADAAASGTALSDVPTAANNINLAPERTRSTEIGTKWDLFRERLSVTAAVYRTEKTNARTRNATNDPFVLDGRQRVDGIEFGVSGQVTSRWTMLAGLSMMDSDIAASANPAEQGANLALVPQSSFNLWTTYQAPFGLTVGGGAQFQDNVFRNSINTLEVPSYWLVNAMASYPVNSHLTLRINGNNLTDSQYVDRVGGGHYIPGPRRAVIVSTDVRF
jgi:catecholate siderophore receptor